jgi:hypothetical protein
MDAAATIQFLLLGGLLGLFGQGARALVGLKTLSDYANGPSPSENDVFNAARLATSLVIGFLAGIAAALTYYALGKDLSAKLDFQLLLGFAGAGYVGTDIIEAFVARYFDGGSETGLKESSAPAIGENVDAINNLAGAIRVHGAAVAGPKAEDWRITLIRRLLGVTTSVTPTTPLPSTASAGGPLLTAAFIREIANSDEVRDHHDMVVDAKVYSAKTYGELAAAIVPQS